MLKFQILRKSSIETDVIKLKSEISTFWKENFNNFQFKMLRECISLSMPKEKALFRAPWTLDDGEKSSNSADKRFKTPYLDLWEWLQEDDEKVEKHPHMVFKNSTNCYRYKISKLPELFTLKCSGHVLSNRYFGLI